MPNPLKVKEIPIFSSKLVSGIFLVWDTDPGGKSNKSYLAISIEDAIGSNTRNSRVQSIQRIREVEIPSSISYPLYDKECVDVFKGVKPTTWKVESTSVPGSDAGSASDSDLPPTR